MNAWGAQSTWSGPFTGPGSPITPSFPSAEPRQYDYPSGANSNTIPRSEYGGRLAPFFALWAMYEAMDVLQVAVTFRTQQILSLDWKLERRPGSGFQTHDGDEARRLLELPDPQMDYSFEQWLGSILTEVYVTDALTIQPVRNKLGRTVALPQIDGTTIKPIIDQKRGAYAAPPDPAFVQFINGTAFTWFTSSELIYRPFRPRPWCVYGTSRTEKVLNTALLYGRHEHYASDWFTQGNIPEAAAIVDPAIAGDIPPEKYREWQEQMDQVSGENVSRRRVHLMPPFVKLLQQLKTFSFDRGLPDWLVRIFCIEFGVPSYLFTSETNRSTAKEMNEALFDTPLLLDLMSIKRLVDKILKVSGFPELQFTWAKKLDYSKEAIEGITMLVDKGIMTVPESRLYLGLAQGEEAAGAGAEDTELDSAGDPTDGSNADGSSAGDANEDSASDGIARESAAAAPLAAKGRSSNVISILTTKDRTTPHSGKKVGKAFIGRGATKKAALSTGLARPILKRLRQQQASIMNEGLAMARARGKKVKGV